VKARHVIPSANILRELLKYDPLTGIFTWKETRGRVRKGEVAGWKKKGTRYTKISVNGVIYYAHRLAWVMYYEQEPPAIIDHIDRDKCNNRIANLRDTTQARNNYNTGTPRNNTSGFKGVRVKPSRRKKFQAYIAINGKQQSLGYYLTGAEASEAYQQAISELLDGQEH